MDPMNPTPSPINPRPMTPLAPTMPRKKFPLLAVVITLVVTAVVIGGAAYYLLMLQISAANDNLTQMSQKITENKAAQEKINNDLSLCEAGKQTAIDDLNSFKQAALAADEAVYADWQNYTNTDFGFSMKYPADWTMEERSIKKDPVFSKNGNCTDFKSEDKTVLLELCYRLKTDANATTWFLTGLGATSEARVNLDLKFGDRTITEKTIFSDNKKVKNIIYAQNVKDDESGYPARIAVGNKYFSIIAGATGDWKTTEITSAEQMIIDNILASFQLNQSSPSTGTNQ